jgi:cobyrinic acid a,c-diamide synthase
VDVEGTHSTAALAQLLKAPVVLVLSACKVTRTVAATVVGCQHLAPGAAVRGVILNQIASSRHESSARQAVEELAGVPVLGVIPRLHQNPLPERHLGLLPPQEHARSAALGAELARIAEEHLDLRRLLELAQAAPELERAAPDAAKETAHQGPGVPAPPVSARVGVFFDSAFTFYYPENLEALEAAGAELVLLSGLRERGLPDVDALYLGGGFPETHAAELAANVALKQEVYRAAERGMPIYAECGGLIYLSRSLRVGGERHSMAGVLPVDLELLPRPQGHGYVELRVDHANPFFAEGQVLRGHEFHYTRICGGEAVATAFDVRRGTGCGAARDGVMHRNVVGSYTHLHATGAPEWAPALVRCASSFREKKKECMNSNI